MKVTKFLGNRKKQLANSLMSLLTIEVNKENTAARKAKRKFPLRNLLNSLICTKQSIIKKYSDKDIAKTERTGKQRLNGEKIFENQNLLSGNKL